MAFQSSRFIYGFLLAMTLLLSSMLSIGAEPNTDLVQFKDNWVKASYPGQTIGAAYLSMTSHQDLTLTHVSADITPAVEIHDMKMRDGIMRMRHMTTLALPKDTTVTLAPGGLHLMLFDLKAPLVAGQVVNFELCFADKAGKITIVPLRSVVKSPE